MDAHAAADPAAVIALLREDARLAILPEGRLWDGRDEITPDYLQNMASRGEFRCVAIGANRQSGVASYLRAWGDTDYRPLGLVVLGIEGGALVDFTAFTSGPELFAAFGLPATA